MKFKTRLRVTFATIVFLPLLLTALAFCLIGIYLMNSQPGVIDQNMDIALISESMETFTGHANDVYRQLAQQAQQDVTLLEDREYLSRMDNLLRPRSAYLLVRRDNEIYYAGNQEAAERIFNLLPEYGEGDLGEGTGYYFSELDKYVKQIDFEFQDGEEGSLFVIMRINTLISRQLLIDMVIAIVLILVFTSLMLTQWIHKEVFRPINELNLAMTKIKEGNFGYMLQTKSGGEIGDLYRNYEDMRLRLKENAEENQEQEKKNKELVSNISHDLKTPITAIKGYVEGIMDGVADTPEKMDKYIKTIYNKANDMDKLINELTIYSGIDNHRIPYNFHRINVSDYFGDCVEEVGLDLESKNIQLNYTNLLDQDTLVIADPEQMKKVINNIISNSVKYMDKQQGIIDIRILDEVDSIQVEIEDNGKGIAQKDLGKIFERFYRTDASRNSLQGGSGIGLSIVKKIIEDHGGYIWATSREGEGTCMHFVIRKYRELQNE
ncbi:MAG: HAMP domain-containing histidine kinase [bacterium]|nr:HAMP domain-containing histidine kinase [bacterium]MCM1374410.1 HAMP domain-containing histidine kinase [Muribaculum sp.]